MKNINPGLMFKPDSNPTKLLELLSDFTPRTAKQIKADYPSIDIPTVAKRANKKLMQHGLEIQTQLHPHQKDWFWLLVETTTGGRNYAG